MEHLNIGFALTGSFCTFRRAKNVIRRLAEHVAEDAGGLSAEMKEARERAFAEAIAMIREYCDESP